MATDFAALLQELQNNLPTRMITSNTLKDITIHVQNPNNAVDSPNAEYYDEATDTHVLVTEYLSGGGWNSVVHEVKSLNGNNGVYLEGDSAGKTFINDGIYSPPTPDCKDVLFGPKVHDTGTNTGHFTTLGLYLERGGPFRSVNDRLIGANGNDVLDGKTGTDALYGEGGHDILKGGTGNDELHGGAGTDFLFGQEDSDSLYGEADDDYLDGGAGNDSLYGGVGDDYLIGGKGHDYLEGGAGIDTYVYARGDGSDVFSESASALPEDSNDMLYLSGVTDVYITKIYDDLMLLFSLNTGDNDSVTIKDWFKAGGEGQGLEYIAIVDWDAVYNTADLAALATDVTPTGTASLSVGGAIPDLAAVDFDVLSPVDVPMTGLPPLSDMVSLGFA